MSIKKIILLGLICILNGCSDNPYSESYSWRQFIFNLPESPKESLYEALGEYSRCIAYDLGKMNATGSCDIDKRSVRNVLQNAHFHYVSLKQAMDKGYIACMKSVSKQNQFNQTLLNLAGGPAQTKINISEYQQICARKLQVKSGGVN